MNYFPSLLSIIITLFLLMVAGFYCRKRNIIDTVASKKLSSLIICVGQPMLIIGALAKAEFNAENLALALQATLLGAVAHLLMAAASYLICKKMKQTDETKIFEFTLILYHSPITHCAKKITSGRVAVERSEVSPTVCDA